MILPSLKHSKLLALACILFVLLLLSACGSSSRDQQVQPPPPPPTFSYAEPPDRNDGWNIANAADLGLTSNYWRQ